MATEIVRNFLDVQRYNKLEVKLSIAVNSYFILIYFYKEMILFDKRSVYDILILYFSLSFFI